MREFDLQLAFLRLGTAAKDLENEPRTVEHLGFPFVFKVTLLDRRQCTIHHNELHILPLDQSDHLLDLAFAEIGRRPNLAQETRNVTWGEAVNRMEGRGMDDMQVNQIMAKLDAQHEPIYLCEVFGEREIPDMELAAGLRWRSLDPDVHLGYRKSSRGGVWLIVANVCCLLIAYWSVSLKTKYLGNSVIKRRIRFCCSTRCARLQMIKARFGLLSLEMERHPELALRAASQA
jgi:hypothetical protein